MQVDEQDYAKWLEEAGAAPERAGEIPLKIKFRIMRLMAAVWVLGDLAQYYISQGEEELLKTTMAEREAADDELAGWKAGMPEKFG